MDRLAALLAFGLSATVAGIISREARRRREVRDLREDVQVWEGEGGQVPGGTLGAAANKPPAGHPTSYSAPT